jgi:hypothetical protein
VSERVPEEEKSHHSRPKRHQPGADRGGISPTQIIRHPGGALSPELLAALDLSVDRLPQLIHQLFPLSGLNDGAGRLESFALAHHPHLLHQVEAAHHGDLDRLDLGELGGSSYCIFLQRGEILADAQVRPLERLEIGEIAGDHVAPLSCFGIFQGREKAFPEIPFRLGRDDFIDARLHPRPRDRRRHDRQKRHHPGEDHQHRFVSQADLRHGQLSNVPSAADRPFGFHAWDLSHISGVSASPIFPLTPLGRNQTRERATQRPPARTLCKSISAFRTHFSRNSPLPISIIL